MDDDFKATRVSTITVVCPSNLHVDHAWLYDSIRITEFEWASEVKDDAGFQKRLIQENPPFGTITMAKYKTFNKGFRHVKKPPFRNNIVMNVYVGKLISVKIPVEGKIHFSGCKEDIHYERFFEMFCRHLSTEKSSPTTWFITDSSPLSFYILNISHNMVKDTGLKINRVRLNQFMNQQTPYRAIYIPSGNPGVKIRIDLEINHDELMIKRIRPDDTNQLCIDYIPYQEYLDTPLPCKFEYKNTGRKKNKNTFFIFHSGKVNMYGLIPYVNRDYKRLLKILYDNRQHIEYTTI